MTLSHGLLSVPAVSCSSFGSISQFCPIWAPSYVINLGSLFSYIVRLKWNMSLLLLNLSPFLSEPGICFDESDKCQQFLLDGKCTNSAFHEYANFCRRSCGMCGKKFTSNDIGNYYSSTPLLFCAVQLFWLALLWCCSFTGYLKYF